LDHFLYIYIFSKFNYIFPFVESDSKRALGYAEKERKEKEKIENKELKIKELKEKNKLKKKYQKKIQNYLPTTLIGPIVVVSTT